MIESVAQCQQMNSPRNDEKKTRGYFHDDAAVKYE